jgi:hypothetical protein
MYNIVKYNAACDKYRAELTVNLHTIRANTSYILYMLVFAIMLIMTKFHVSYRNNE